MGSKVQKIFQVYDAAEEYLAKESIDVSKNQIKKAMESIYSPGPSFQMIFDFPSRTFDYVSDNLKEILGLDPTTFSPEILVDCIHPTDLQHMVNCETIAASFFFKVLERNEIPNYKVTYQYRIKDIENTYRCFLHQAITLSRDSQGNMSKTLVNLSDISYIGPINNKRVSFIDVKNNKSYTNISKVEDLFDRPEDKNYISEREIEILRLISEGFNSNEIAAKLFISKNTVRTHRNNILQKTDLKTIPQAIAYFIREGLL